MSDVFINIVRNSICDQNRMPFLQERNVNVIGVVERYVMNEDDLNAVLKEGEGRNFTLLKIKFILWNGKKKRYMYSNI